MLDEATETIHLPLEKYYMTSQEALMVQHVNDLRIDECLSRSGRHYAPVQAAWQDGVASPNRQYGIWSVTNAARYGYDLPTDGYTASVTALIAETGIPDPAQTAAEDKCAASIDNLAVYYYGSGNYDDASLFMKVVDDGVAGGSAAAGRSESFPILRQKLVDCLQEQGISVADGQWFTPEIPADEERAVKVAVADAQCHQSTGITQGLSDVEAQYQAAYETEHETELAAIKTRVDAIVDEAEDYLAKHG
ncbi:hypothetical protein HQQ80_00945 [Microbacteriaceae bacterium VKM Ac-2855]|nr:hypothetical protein [Microbacteriaceae bacterium VKM Ac-2855]